jgi:tetratricopeptide (TPR) repeat protein
MRAAAVTLCSLLLASTAVAGWNPFAPKVVYTRTVPAPHNLGPLRDVDVVEINASGEGSRAFRDAFLAWIDQGKFFNFRDVHKDGVTISRMLSDKREQKDFLARYPADVLLRIDFDGCIANDRTRVDQQKDKNGNKISKTKYWTTAECRASGQIFDAADGRELGTFNVTGEDQSSESEKMYSYTHDGTVNGAAAEAAHRLHQQFTPRQEKEGVVLEKEAPAFKEAMAYIKNDRLADAKAVWEAELAKSPSNPALLYDLGAVNEAFGDATAARKYYEAAQQAKPSDERYGKAITTLDSRVRDAEALKKRP